MTAAERGTRRYRLAQRGVEPPEEPVNLQEERSDVRTEEERWQWSLELAAGDAIALRAFWTLGVRSDLAAFSTVSAITNPGPPGCCRMGCARARPARWTHGRLHPHD